MKTQEEIKEYIKKVNNLKVRVDESKIKKDKIDEIIEKVEKENKDALD